MGLLGAMGELPVPVEGLPTALLVGYVLPGWPCSPLIRGLPPVSVALCAVALSAVSFEGGAVAGEGGLAALVVVFALRAAANFGFDRDADRWGLAWEEHSRVSSRLAWSLADSEDCPAWLPPLRPPLQSL